MAHSSTPPSGSFDGGMIRAVRSGAAISGRTLRATGHAVVGGTDVIGATEADLTGLRGSWTAAVTRRRLQHGGTAGHVQHGGGGGLRGPRRRHPPGGDRGDGAGGGGTPAAHARVHQAPAGGGAEAGRRRAGGDAQGTGGDRPAADPVVELREVSVRFGRGRRAVRALDGVSLTVRPGETVGLVGESGSGKSTAARVALSLVPPSSGSVSLFGVDPGRTRGRARRALPAGVGVVLRDPVASLDARMSVAECVAEPLRVQRRRMSAAERRARVGDALELVRLPRELAHRGPRELSGGQRQRVSRARAAGTGAAAAGRRRADERARRERGGRGHLVAALAAEPPVSGQPLRVVRALLGSRAVAIGAASRVRAELGAVTRV